MQPRRLILGLALAGTLLATAWLAFEPDPAEGPPAAKRGAGQRGDAAGGNARARAARRPQDEPLAIPNADVLLREPFGTAATNLFAAHDWQPPPVVAPTSTLAPKPKAPPLPFRFLGQLLEGGRAVVFLGVGERTLLARAGDLLEGQYRIESIDAGNIVFLYQPLNERRLLPIGISP